MKKRLIHFFYFLTLMLLLHIQVFSQTQNITGTITAEDGKAIESATVSVKGGAASSVTNAGGVFTISAKTGDVLLVSAVGYQLLELPVTGTVVNAVMRVQNESLEQVVVVGYSKQKKVNLTGAVSTITGEELTKRPVFNTSVALQGTLPGVTVSQFNGVPGSEAQIRIRGLGTLGSNEPLILIDGVVAAFGDVDPNNIENISVLKDAASASIYGSRAAAGVILITSKRGRSGRMKVDYDAFAGFQAPVDRPKYLDAVNFMKLHNEALTNEGAAPKRRIYSTMFGLKKN
jgi:TonB-dependent SusC/RagA subfamily outer membrane receptor